jgi:hypothetical protein
VLDCIGAHQIAAELSGANCAATPIFITVSLP